MMMGMTSKIVAVERQRKALELRKAGVPYDVIADEVGYSSPQSAWRAVDAALKNMIQEPVVELRGIQIERLNYALMKIWPKVQAGDERAIDTMLRIQERLDRLMGTEAPQQVEHHHDGAVLVIDGNEDDYVAAMERMARQAGAIEVPSEETPVRTPVAPLELDPGTKDQMSLFDAAAGHTGAEDGIVEAVLVEEPTVCPRFVRPADAERASKGLCARCNVAKADHA